MCCTPNKNNLEKNAAFFYEFQVRPNRMLLLRLVFRAHQHQHCAIYNFPVLAVQTSTSTNIVVLLLASSFVCITSIQMFALAGSSSNIIFVWRNIGWQFPSHFAWAADVFVYVPELYARSPIWSRTTWTHTHTHNSWRLSCALRRDGLELVLGTHRSVFAFSATSSASKLIIGTRGNQTVIFVDIVSRPEMIINRAISCSFSWHTGCYMAERNGRLFDCWSIEAIWYNFVHIDYESRVGVTANISTPQRYIHSSNECPMKVLTLYF